MLGNSSCPRPLALLADLDRAAKALGTRFARLACFPMGRKHPQGAVMRLSRLSRLARALRERPRIARVSGRPRRASNASGLDPLTRARPWSDYEGIYLYIPSDYERLYRSRARARGVGNEKRRPLWVA